MSTQVTLTLPDGVFQRAERLAQLSRRDIASLLADTIAASLPLLRPRAKAPVPVGQLTDAQLLALTDLRLPAAQDRRLNGLLDRQPVSSPSRSA